MKPFSKNQVELRKATISAHTLVEMMIVGAIFGMIVTAMVSAQLWGMRTYTLAKIKLTDTAAARNAMNNIRDNIRQAQAVYVGNYASFTNMTFGTNAFPSISSGAQQGNALMVLTTTNLSPFIVFYLNVPTKQLKAYDSSRTNIEILAGNIIDTNIFDAESYTGSVLTNNQDNRTIRMKLEFYQSGYLGTHNTIGDYYQLTMRATERNLP